jgi:hypothetical protein
MAKQKTTTKDAKTGRFVIGESFLKISLVEGIRITDDMKKRAADAQHKGSSPDEYRRTIVRSYRKS